MSPRLGHLTSFPDNFQKEDGNGNFACCDCKDEEENGQPGKLEEVVYLVILSENCQVVAKAMETC